MELYNVITPSRCRKWNILHMQMRQLSKYMDEALAKQQPGRILRSLEKAQWDGTHRNYTGRGYSVDLAVYNIDHLFYFVRDGHSGRSKYILMAMAGLL